MCNPPVKHEASQSNTLVPPQATRGVGWRFGSGEKLRVIIRETRLRNLTRPSFLGPEILYEKGERQVLKRGKEKDTRLALTSFRVQFPAVSGNIGGVQTR